MPTEVRKTQLLPLPQTHLRLSTSLRTLHMFRVICWWRRKWRNEQTSGLRKQFLSRNQCEYLD